MDLNQERLKNRQRILQLWTKQLINEYENICYCHRVKLRRPVIEVCELTNKWGLWSPEARVISVSSTLVEKFSWEVVVQILKHEMAHQIVTDIFKVDDGHGQEFSRACTMLGVIDWAAKASGDIPGSIRDWKAGSPNDEAERLLRRVEKLLALASSSNEHEAALAMQRVQEIYARYNLDRLEQKHNSQMVSSLLCPRKKRLPRHHSLICSLLNDFFFVRVIHTTNYCAKDLCEYKAVELLGTRENVLMADYVYYFLSNRLERLWHDYKKKMGCAASVKRSYLSGILSGFREKLENTQLAQTTSAKTSLVALKDPELEQFVKLKYPRLVNLRRSGASFDAESYGAGREEGRRLIIHKGIEAHDGNRGRLLTR